MKKHKKSNNLDLNILRQFVVKYLPDGYVADVYCSPLEWLMIGWTICIKTLDGNWGLTTRGVDDKMPDEDTVRFIVEYLVSQLEPYTQIH